MAVVPQAIADFLDTSTSDEWIAECERLIEARDDTTNDS